MEQGSVLEYGRHSPGPCHHLQGPTQNPGEGGRKESICYEWQPYPKLAEYVVHPIDGKGHSHTLHQNFMLPINHNLEQDEGKNTVQEASGNEPTLVLHEEDALPANCPTKRQLESTPHSWSKQCKLIDRKLTESTTLDFMDEGLQISDDAPAPLR